MAGKAPVQRIKAEKIFTDRVEPRAAFDKMLEELKQNIEEMYVLSYYGIGGIGKTKLLEILSQKVKNDVIHVVYDFNFGTSPRDVVMSLRNLLAKQGFVFYCLNAAEEMYVEKSGRNTMEAEVQRESLISRLLNNEYADLIMEGLGAFVPGVSLLVKGANALNKTTSEIGEFLKKKPEEYKELVKEMDGMDGQSILNRFPEYFARDLEYNIKTTQTPVVIMLDTYEKLVDTYCTIGYQSTADHWLREQIVDMVPGVMWVIAGRERLDWAQKDSSWEGMIDEHRLGDLGEKDTKLFLEAAKIPQNLWDEIYKLTEGTPAFLDICVEDYYLLKSRNNTEITMSMLAGKSSKKEDLLERFLRYMDTEEKELAEVQAMFGVWREEQVKRVCKHIYGRFNERLYKESLEHSIIYVNEQKQYYMHDLVRKFIVKYMEPSIKKMMYLEVVNIIKEGDDNYSLAYEFLAADVERYILQLSDVDLTVKEYITVYENFKQLDFRCYAYDSKKKNQLEQYMRDVFRKRYVKDELYEKIDEKYALSQMRRRENNENYYVYEVLKSVYGETDSMTLNYMLTLGDACSEEKMFAIRELEDAEQNGWDVESVKKRVEYYTYWEREFIGSWYEIGRQSIGFENLEFIHSLSNVISLYVDLGNQEKALELGRLRKEKYYELVGPKHEFAILENYWYGCLLERYGLIEDARECYENYLHEAEEISTEHWTRHVLACKEILVFYHATRDVEKISMIYQKVIKLMDFASDNVINGFYRYARDHYLKEIIDTLSCYEDLIDKELLLKTYDELCNPIESQYKPIMMDFDGVQLSIRNWNSLMVRKIDTIEKLCALSYEQLLGIKLISAKGRKEIYDKLLEVGVDFAFKEEYEQNEKLAEKNKE